MRSVKITFPHSGKGTIIMDKDTPAHSKSFRMRARQKKKKKKHTRPPRPTTTQSQWDVYIHHARGKTMLQEKNWGKKEKDYGLQIMKTQNSVSQKFEYYIRSIKKDILNRNIRLLKSMFISMQSILGWASFCMNYCINVAWHETISLWHCSGAMEAQVALPSGHLHCWVWWLSSSSWQYPIYSLLGSGQGSLLANKAQ